MRPIPSLGSIPRVNRQSPQAVGLRSWWPVNAYGNMMKDAVGTARISGNSQFTNYDRDLGVHWDVGPVAPRVTEFSLPAGAITISFWAKSSQATDGIIMDGLAW